MIKKLFHDAITKGSTRIFAATGLIIGLMIGGCLRVLLSDFSLQAAITWGILIIVTAAILITFDLVINKESRDYLKVIILVFITAIAFFLACILGIWLGGIIIPPGDSGSFGNLISSLLQGAFSFLRGIQKIFNFLSNIFRRNFMFFIILQLLDAAALGFFDRFFY